MVHHFQITKYVYFICIVYLYLLITYIYALLIYGKLCKIHNI